MAFYASPRLYIESSTDLADSICRIDTVIKAMEAALPAAVAGQESYEYKLDTGQTKINVTTRSMTELVEGLTKLHQLKNYYVNQYNGPGMQLQDFQANRLAASIWGY